MQRLLVLLALLCYLCAATVPGQAQFWGGNGINLASPVLFSDGTVSAPGIGFAAEPNTGWFRDVNGLAATVAGAAQFRMVTGYFHIGASKLSYGATVAGGTDTAVERTSGGLLEINNGTTGTYRDLKVRKIMMEPPAAQTIGAGGTVTADACGGLKEISSAGAVTTSTTNTFDAPAAANKGCVMFVCNTGANNITLDNNALFKSKAAGDVVLTAEDCISVASNGSVWRQLTDILSAN